MEILGILGLRENMDFSTGNVVSFRVKTPDSQLNTIIERLACHVKSSGAKMVGGLITAKPRSTSN